MCAFGAGHGGEPLAHRHESLSVQEAPPLGRHRRPNRSHFRLYGEPVGSPPCAAPEAQPEELEMRISTRTTLGLLALILSCSVTTLAQRPASLRGQITDQLGAVIVGATVTLTDANGK